MNKYQKAKTKWVKERLLEAVFRYHPDCCLEHQSLILEWDKHFKTWQFPNIGENTEAGRISEYFWKLGNNIYEKFFELRKITKTNDNFEFYWRSKKQIKKENEKAWKAAGLMK